MTEENRKRIELISIRQTGFTTSQIGIHRTEERELADREHAKELIEKDKKIQFWVESWNKQESELKYWKALAEKTDKALRILMLYGSNSYHYNLVCQEIAVLRLRSE
jgi:hypothetical protein